MNAIVVKQPHYTRTRRAAAWAEERARKVEKRRRRIMRSTLKGQKAAERNILPEQAQHFNPIRGLAKVA